MTVTVGGDAFASSSRARSRLPVGLTDRSNKLIWSVSRITIPTFPFLTALWSCRFAILTAELHGLLVCRIIGECAADLVPPLLLVVAVQLLAQKGYLGLQSCQPGFDIAVLHWFCLRLAACEISHS